MYEPTGKRGRKKDNFTKIRGFDDKKIVFNSNACCDAVRMFHGTFSFNRPGNIRF
jgi:hypothetical protein